MFFYRYDVTFYLAIEQLLKVKLPQFPVTKDKAMLYFDQSEEAGRLAKLVGVTLHYLSLLLFTMQQ